jgi:hypothetical protein
MYGFGLPVIVSSKMRKAIRPRLTAAMDAPMSVGML